MTHTRHLAARIRKSVTVRNMPKLRDTSQVGHLKTIYVVEAQDTAPPDTLFWEHGLSCVAVGSEVVVNGNRESSEKRVVYRVCTVTDEVDTVKHIHTRLVVLTVGLSNFE